MPAVPVTELSAKNEWHFFFYEGTQGLQAHSFSAVLCHLNIAQVNIKSIMAACQAL